MNLPASRMLRFPKLSLNNHEKTSDETKIYNCVSWSLGFQDRWIDNAGSDRATWPVAVPRTGSFVDYINLFKYYGFEECTLLDVSIDSECVKIALYSDKNDFSHVAIQKEDGTWSSKLGGWEDIRHDTPESLTGTGWPNGYGEIKMIMKKKRTS